MSKDDFLCVLILLGLFLVFCLAPDLYNPSYVQSV
jgi:hypothetical protein